MDAFGNRAAMLIALPELTGKIAKVKKDSGGQVRYLVMTRTKKR